VAGATPGPSNRPHGLGRPEVGAQLATSAAQGRREFRAATLQGIAPGRGHTPSKKWHLQCRLVAAAGIGIKGLVVVLREQLRQEGLVLFVSRRRHHQRVALAAEARTPRNRRWLEEQGQQQAGGACWRGSMAAARWRWVDLALFYHPLSLHGVSGYYHRVAGPPLPLREENAPSTAVRV